MSSLGVFSDECFTFLDMMNDIGIDKKQQLYIIRKIMLLLEQCILYFAAEIRFGMAQSI